MAATDPSAIMVGWHQDDDEKREKEQGTKSPAAYGHEYHVIRIMAGGGNEGGAQEVSPNDKTILKKTGPAPVRALVPMMHVADVERSVEFYRLLGFEIGNRQPKEGRMQWAWLYAPKVSEWRHGPNLMIARGERPGAPEAQDVLFYLYATDLVPLRNELMARGLKVGEIGYPFYLPQGEFRMEDPDGYVLMIAQAGPDTP